jgi:chaperone BCS1
VYRTIELTQRFNQYGKVWDGSQKNHLLQKAIAIYLAEQLDLSGKNARYELLENKTKLLRNVSKKLEDELEIDDNASDTTCSVSSSSSSSSYDSDDDYCNEVNKLNVGPLPPNNAWVEVQKGIEFKHEVVKNDDEGQGDVKNVKVSKIVFHFRAKKEVGTAPVDRLIQRAFENYQEAEKKKYTSDTSRYMYVRTGDLSSSSNKYVENSSSASTYKRYALGEEKTFYTLFFD